MFTVVTVLMLGCVSFVQCMNFDNVLWIHINIDKEPQQQNTEFDKMYKAIGNNKHSFLSGSAKKNRDLCMKDFKRDGIGEHGSYSARLTTDLSENQSITITGLATLIENNTSPFIVFETSNGICGVLSRIQINRINYHSRNIDLQSIPDPSAAIDNIVHLCELKSHPHLFKEASTAVLNILEKFKKQYDEEGPHLGNTRLNCAKECQIRKEKEQEEAAEITAALKPFVAKIKKEKKSQEKQQKMEQEQWCYDQYKRKIALISLFGGSLLAIILAIVGYQKYFTA